MTTRLLRYEVGVASHLDTSWSAWLGDADIAHEDDGTTSLAVTVPDQAALHGLLDRLRDLGVPLLSLRLLEPTPFDDDA
jgi:hypothetical protein